MDIQDLLDEVEEVMQDRPSAKHSSKSSIYNNYDNVRSDDALRAPSSSRKKTDDIDDLLKMIGDDEDDSAAPVYPRRNSSSTASFKPASSKSEEFHVSSGVSKKCSTPILGGESAKRGLNTASASHNVCANLRCNECDFTVVQFLGKKWASNADYMFFRENVPNEAKLRARMEFAPDSAAYACQCKWLSIDVQTRVDMCRVKWSCAGH